MRKSKTISRENVLSVVFGVNLKIIKISSVIFGCKRLQNEPHDKVAAFESGEYQIVDVTST